MTVTISPCRAADLGALHALARHPSLAFEFEPLQTDEGFDDLMGDPFVAPDLRWIVFLDGAPAGFAFSFLAPTHGGSFAMVRMGILDHLRRRGLGSRLLATALSGLEAIRDQHGLNEVSLSAWEPNPAAEAFAGRHGFRFARTFWRMERPRSPVERPVWPDGVSLRTFGDDGTLAAFHAAYNAAFADHYHYVRSSLSDTEALTRQGHFRPDGLVLAYRGGACVGFCRNSLFGGPGELALIGVVPEARGLGLGRALLRWGVAWLQRHQADPLYLMVDGGNESALGLYRSEGFQVARTRIHWSRMLAG